MENKIGGEGEVVLTTIKDKPKAKLDTTLRDDLFNSAILPAIFYASEIWATTKKDELVMTLRAIEGYILRERI